MIYRDRALRKRVDVERIAAKDCRVSYGPVGERAVLPQTDEILRVARELRRNDQVRLAIDPKTIKRKGDTVSFRYIVDYRQPQGDYKTGIVYRSLATKAHIRCKARMIVTEETEAYPGNEAKGPSLGVMKPGKGEDMFKKLEAGTSDEDLHKRCFTPGGTPISVWKWLRAMVEHEAHHRGQIYLYLSMLDIPTPPLYGLTSEEVLKRSEP